jgi:hypothetical protein
MEEDKEFTPEQYNKTMKKFNEILELGTPSTTISKLLEKGFKKHEVDKDAT